MATLILLHMLSRVHNRVMSRPIGNFSLNLVVPPSSTTDGTAASGRLAAVVARLYALLMPRSKAFTANVNILNSTPLYPIKDYDRNYLRHGALQTGPGTCIVVDETSLTAGTLNNAGVKNVRVLSRLLQDQILEYDFQFHQMDFQVDNPCVVVSKGKSILPCDLRAVMTVPEDLLPTNLPEPTDDMLAGWRNYLLLSRQLAFDLSQQATEMVSDSLVALRKADPQVNEHTFHVRLTLARLFSVSYLEPDLSPERWQELSEFMSRVTLA